MRRIRTIAIFPTLLTLANLVCGFYAIVVASRIDAPTALSDKTPLTSEINFRQIPKVPWIIDRSDPTQNIVLCGWLIVLGMLFDALDGRVARLANQTSDFGAQLDSLSDLVTFGAAPAFLMVKMCPHFSFEHRNWVWIIATVYVCCTALRLARFNVETTEEDDHSWFNGLPTPAAAAAIAGFALIFYMLRSTGSGSEDVAKIDELVQWVLPMYAVLVSLLMVSRIPYPHLVNQFVRGQKSFAHLIGLIFGLLPILVFPGYAIPILAAGFVVIPPLHYIWQRFYRHRRQDEPIF
ncbi:MAG: CDP-diacylglycerol--serine O-phosphatidyltransferase [Planctomycetota bacterium]|nr:CDP-diacylglycerol--serine O-phosphatidyltransferase [Planctomycetota bacterium]